MLRVKYPNLKSEFHSNDVCITFGYHHTLCNCTHLTVISPHLNIPLFVRMVLKCVIFILKNIIYHTYNFSEKNFKVVGTALETIDSQCNKQSVVMILHMYIYIYIYIFTKAINS